MLPIHFYNTRKKHVCYFFKNSMKKLTDESTIHKEKLHAMLIKKHNNDVNALDLPVRRLCYDDQLLIEAFQFSTENDNYIVFASFFVKVDGWNFP